jgi:CHAD domain-containing protein
MDKKLGALTIERYATAQAEAFLERLAWQVRHTAKRCDPQAVHDLRVVIRQLMNCLRIFKHFFPRRPRQKIRRQLGVMRDLAGEVRNRDITLEILASVLSSPDEKLSPQLTHERERAKGELVKALHRWTRRNLFRKWRATLGL